MGVLARPIGISLKSPPSSTGIEYQAVETATAGYEHLRWRCPLDADPTPTNLYDLSLSELEELLISWGEPAYRAKQIWDWMYLKGATQPDEMTNLPKALRVRLEQFSVLGALEISALQTSKDGTEKRLYHLNDGQLIEAVLMPYADNRRTACISSQAGCAMGCVFCATGQMGFARHLSSTEIFEQAALFSRDLRQRGERLSNVVLMGMGEPFHNYDAVLVAIRRLMTDLGIGARHITVSTVGLPDKIRQFSNEGMPVTLAISLHAATDAERSSLLPINRRHPIGDLMAACRQYSDKTHRRVTFEWALIAGENDNVETAQALGRLLKGMLCHVNLIPLNVTAGYEGNATSNRAAVEFVDTLRTFGVTATLRVRRGIDIDAGCGQLKAAVISKDS